MREVYINHKQVDVNQADAVDIIYESPIFSDISKIKSNTTTTYTLPKTDRNLAIFRNADQHDVEQMYKDKNGNDTSMAYAEQRFDEFRNGLPIIQNGRCRLLKIADKIELAVVWGAKVPLSEKLGKKLNDIVDIEYDEKGNVKTSPAYVKWTKDNFLKVEPIPENETDQERNERHKKNAFGFLFADFGQGAFNLDETGKKEKKDRDNIKIEHIFPSASVGYILEKAIARDAGIKVEIKNDAKGDILDVLYEKWIPCVTKKIAPEIVPTSASAVFEYDGEEKVRLNITEGREFGLIDESRTLLKIPVGSYGLVLQKTTHVNDPHQIKAYYLLSRESSLYTQNWKLRVKLNYESHYLAEVSPSDVKGHPVADDRILMELVFRGTFDWETVLTNDNENGIVREYPIELEFYNEMSGVVVPFIKVESTTNGMVSYALPLLPVSLTVAQQVANEDKDFVLLNSNFPIMKNLPDMTGIDFVKSVCQMYCLFPHFDIKNNTLKFLQIDDIFDPQNIARAKNWDNKVIAEPWSIERSFGDYAKKNRLKYQDDDTVTTTSEGFMELDNQILIAQKDLSDLKFSATDIKNDLAHLPLFVTKENSTDAPERKDIKPRILSMGGIYVKEAETTTEYKALTFDKTMFFETENVGLVDTYYGRYRDVVSKPVLRDVVVMLNEVELMNMSTFDIIYLRGKYWMPIKIQVGIDGKAQARLMLLPNVFN